MVRGAASARPMHVRAIMLATKVGPFPELWTYRCGHCGDVRTVERDEE